MNRKEYRVLLISFNSAWKHGNIGIDQLTGFLRKKGFNIDLLHVRTRVDDNEVFETIKDNYQFYGFSVTSSNYTKCLRIIRMIKNYRSDIITEFGGGYASRYYREIFTETKDLDFITHGDGETPTEYLLSRLIDGSLGTNSNQTGHYAVSSQLDFKNKRDYLNLSIPYFPAFDYYEKDTMLRNFRKIHCIQTKNNVCTGNCTFCTERHGKVAYRPISQIIDQIRYVVDNYGVKKIFFTDDNIFDPNNEAGKQHVTDLCIELLRLKSQGYKLVYQCYIKAISLHDTVDDNKILELMKEVGFVEVFVGIESGNNEDLILYNKKTTVTDNYTIVSMLKKHGLFPILGFIGFNPYSTLEKIAKNFNYLCDNQCTYLPNYIYCFVNINKYTEIYRMAQKDNLLLDDNEYINIPFKYIDSKVQTIADYIQDEMIPRLSDIQYETDWIIFNYMERRILYSFNECENILKEIKKKDFEVIKKYLSILFLEHDVDKFKTVAEEFWSHFLSQQNLIKSIYQKMIRLNSLSSVLKFYRAKLCPIESRFFNSSVCPDIQVGDIEIKNKKIIDKDIFFEFERRITRDLEIQNDWEHKTIVVILESPHKNEFLGNEIQPAKGITGKMLQRYFVEVAEQSHLCDGKYRIVLMNSIQYQCSLGHTPDMYRDHIWLSLWFNEKMSENFTKRLKEYRPDVVYNFSTKGSHKKETLDKSLPSHCINDRYIQYCAPAYTGAKKTTTIREIISNYVFLTYPEIPIYEGSHPASWFSRKNLKVTLMEKVTQEK